MSKKDIDRIEKILIEQEHRPIRVIRNYFDRKKLYPNDSEKQKSTKKAIIWRLFFSPGVVATLGGGLGLASLIMLICQNNILLDQNNLVEDQNKWFQQQIISTELSSLKNALINSDKNKSSNNTIFRDYVILQRRYDSISKKTYKITIADIDLSGGNFDDEDFLFNNVTFNNVDFSGSKFSNIEFDGTTFINCKFNSVPELGWHESYLIDEVVNYTVTSFINCDFRGTTINSDCYGFGVLFYKTLFKKNYLNSGLSTFYSTYVECKTGEGWMDQNFKGFPADKTNILARNESQFRQIAKIRKKQYDTALNTISEKRSEASKFEGAKFSDFIDLKNKYDSPARIFDLSRNLIIWMSTDGKSRQDNQGLSLLYSYQKYSDVRTMLSSQLIATRTIKGK